MLAGDYIPAQFPGDVSRSLVDNHHRGDVAETNQNPAVIQGHNGIAVTPFVARLPGGDNIGFQVQVLVGVPVPNLVAGGVHFDQVVGPHIGRGCLSALAVGLHIAAGLSSLYLVCHLGRDGLQGKENGAAGLGAPCVVVLRRVSVLPDDVAVPVHFQQPAADKVGGRHRPLIGLVGLGHVEEIAAGQQVAPGAGRGGQMPPVHLIALHIQ